MSVAQKISKKKRNELASQNNIKNNDRRNNNDKDNKTKQTNSNRNDDINGLKRLASSPVSTAAVVRKKNFRNHSERAHKEGYKCRIKRTYVTQIFLVHEHYWDTDEWQR